MVEAHWCFRGIYPHHLQGYRVSQAKRPAWRGSKQSWFLAWLTLWFWRWRLYIPLKHQWASKTVHHARAQKIVTLHTHCCKNLRSSRFVSSTSVHGHKTKCCYIILSQHFYSIPPFLATWSTAAILRDTKCINIYINLTSGVHCLGLFSYNLRSL
jgi:hypothetical protein